MQTHSQIKTPDCPVCFGACDTEIHEASLRVRAGTRERLGVMLAVQEIRLEALANAPAPKLRRVVAPRLEPRPPVEPGPARKGAGKGKGGGGPLLKIKVDQPFNHWTVIAEVAPFVDPKGKPYRLFSCRCQCGKVEDVRLNSLMHDKKKSCGCHWRKAVVAA